MDQYFQINDLRKIFGKFILGPVDLNLAKGDYFVLLGNTGSGKTSLLKCIAGYYKTERGIIILDNKDIGIVEPNKRCLGFVTQTSDLFPHLTVKENIEFGLNYLKLDKNKKNEKLNYFMELFNLKEIKNQKATTISGGESKRTAIARSLITDPKLLLLDEPLGMLDHNGRKEIIDILKMIHNNLQITTIHVTHDRHEAWSISQKCAVMSKGRIMQIGFVEDIFRLPKSQFVAEFLGGKNILNPDEQLKILNKKNNNKMLLRPELIQIKNKKNDYKLQGKVKSISDFGEFIELEIFVSNFSILTVHSSITENRNINIGDDIYLDWNDEAVHFLEN